MRIKAELQYATVLAALLGMLALLMHSPEAPPSGRVATAGAGPATRAPAALETPAVASR